MRHPFSSQITSWETMLLKSETAHLEEKQQRVRAASYYYCLGARWVITHEHDIVKRGTRLCVF
jgi:hypothetical protein